MGDEAGRVAWPGHVPRAQPVGRDLCGDGRGLPGTRRAKAWPRHMDGRACTQSRRRCRWRSPGSLPFGATPRRDRVGIRTRRTVRRSDADSSRHACRRNLGQPRRRGVCDAHARRRQATSSAVRWRRQPARCRRRSTCRSPKATRRAISTLRRRRRRRSCVPMRPRAGSVRPSGAFDVAASFLTRDRTGRICLDRARPVPAARCLHQAVRRRAPRTLSRRGSNRAASYARARCGGHRCDRRRDLRRGAGLLRQPARRARRSRRQFSLSHGTAFALRTGGLGPDAYSDGVLRDSAQSRLEALVTLTADPSLSARGARVTVTRG